MELDRHQYSAFNELVRAYRERGYNLPSWIGFNRTTLPGVVSINSGTSLDLGLDCPKSATLTLVERMAIDQALEFVRFAREKRLPGMENVHLMRTGGYAMARDTRRLVGEYQFGGKDVVEGTDFKDAIASKYGGSDPVGQQRPYTAIKQGALFPYRSLLSAYDVFASPSGHESFGITFVEAWACGKPVIGTRVGAIPSVIDEGHDGLLVPYGDPHALANAILALLSDPPRGQEMGEARRQKVLAHYTPNTQGSRLVVRET
jgi:glycosyltransferase involved in cell wall biosynthesis